MKEKEIICIVCPIGCQMEVMEGKDTNGYVVTGNACPRGEKYGIKELTDPTRVLTTTIMLKKGKLKRLPVKTDIPIPKGKVLACMKELVSLEVEAPVKAGDILIKDISGTGANIISTRSI